MNASKTLFKTTIFIFQTGIWEVLTDKNQEFGRYLMSSSCLGHWSNCSQVSDQEGSYWKSTGLAHSRGLTLDLECPERILLRQLPSLAQKTSFREPDYFVKILMFQVFFLCRWYPLKANKVVFATIIQLLLTIYSFTWMSILGAQ